MINVPIMPQTTMERRLKTFFDTTNIRSKELKISETYFAAPTSQNNYYYCWSNTTTNFLVEQYFIFKKIQNNNIQHKGNNIIILHYVKEQHWRVKSQSAHRSGGLVSNCSL